MRLKELYIKGFKSFADETIIRFEEDIIGIVGPNGSGKSNIVDAIRWVLGEQKSKELRLESMGDVIFNGTKDRKKGKVAQVAVTFENTKNLIATEYAQIKVSRLLYANGDSEYRLNDIPCRLKDIKSLLMDTGIGSNSYAIIALGMVDDILANKDNARRKMFEQAAGVSKYKIRKRQTLLKLKGTEEDLARVEDLLHEITGQLKSLEKQAKRTEKYYKLKEKYAEISIQHAILSTGNLIERSGGLKERITTENDALRALEIENAKDDASLQELRKIQLDFEQSLSGQQRVVNEMTDSLRQMESDRRSLAQEINFKEQEIEATKKRSESLAEQINAHKEKAELATEQLGLLKEGAEDYAGDLAIIEEKKSALESRHTDKKSGLDHLVTEKRELEQRRFDLEKEWAVLDSEQNKLKNESERRALQLQSQAAELQKLSESLAEIDGKVETSQAEVDQLSTKLEEDTARKTELEDMREQLRAQTQNINRQLDARVHEYDLLKSMVERYEGFPESIQYLAQDKSWGGEDVPLLTDIIGVGAEYRVALEGFLESYLNHFIVQDIAEAKRAIDLLSEGQKGKASFFILDEVQKADNNIDFNQGTAALDLIEVNPQYRALVNKLLHGVYIVDQISDHAPEGVTQVLKDGSSVKKGFVLGGGSVGLFEGKRLGRKKQLEKLEVQIKEQKQEVAGLEKALAEVQDELKSIEVYKLEQQVRSANQRLSHLSQNKLEQQLRLNTIQDKIDDHNSQDTQGTARQNEIAERFDAIQMGLAERNSQIEALDSRLSDADHDYQEMLKELNQLQSEFNEKQILQIQQENREKELARERDFNLDRLHEITSEREGLSSRVEEFSAAVVEMKVKLEELDAKVVDRVGVKKEEQEKLSGQEKEYYGSREKIHAIEDRMRDVSRKITKAQKQLDDLKEEFNDVKIKLSSVRERLRVEFNVNLDEVSKEVDVQDANPVELGQQVEKLRNRINNFGEINPMAIEAYTEIEIRYNEINDQRQDIVDAKESLLNTIEEIENTATTKFLAAFAEVRTHFIDVFRSLFKSEDNCDLILIDPEHPLESEIEIIAKPKGKRPKSLSQLSGGEKTLTATALLFALYLLKPAPFCIFDEVDAPLDDANIEKFNRIIKKFSEQSQFIIVTHNKSTMAAVDTIYGVYMEAMGVSNLSQVDFRHLEHSMILETV